jgi:hypothetical protein
LYSYSLVALPFLSLFLACDLTLEKSKWKPDLISLQGTTKVLPSYLSYVALSDRDPRRRVHSSDRDRDRDRDWDWDWDWDRDRDWDWDWDWGRESEVEAVAGGALAAGQGALFAADGRAARSGRAARRASARPVPGYAPAEGGGAAGLGGCGGGGGWG